MDQQLLVLLLPQRLERFDLEPQARELLRAPGVVAVDPARIPVGPHPGRPSPPASRSARPERMRLPGSPRAVAIFHPLQFYLAGALLARHPTAELWYGEPAPDGVAPTTSSSTAAARPRRADRPRSPPTRLFTSPPLRMAELGILTA